MPSDGPAQKVVVYTNEDGDSVVYATAYTSEQVDFYVSKCLERHGRASRARARDA